MTDEEVCRRFYGLWRHPDGSHIIPIGKHLTRLGKFVAKPFLRRARSFSAAPRPSASDLPPPVPEKRMRRHSISNHQYPSQLFDPDSDSNYRRFRKLNPDPNNPKSARYRHHPYCECEYCARVRELLRGNYAPNLDKRFDPSKPTGADAYSEEWDQWNNRTDFVRDYTKWPPEWIDHRRRSRPRQHQQGPKPVPAGPTPIVPIPPPGLPGWRSRAERLRAAQLNANVVPPAPIVPDHVASYKPNSRLLNPEQEHWAKQQADWKAARLREARDQERHQAAPTPRGRVDEWRRGTEPAPPPPPQRRSRSKSRKPPSADPPAEQPPELRRRHRSRPPAPQNDDDDPFHERALDRARFTEVDRRPLGPAPPVKHKSKPTGKPVERVAREDERGHVSRYVDVANLTEKDQTRWKRAAAKFVEQQAQGLEPMSTSRARELGRAEERGRGPAYVEIGNIERVSHPSRRHRHERRPTGEELDDDNVVTYESTHTHHEKVRIPGHLLGSVPLPDLLSSRPPRPSRPDLRPTTPKDLPSLPKFPSVPADSEPARSRAGSRRARYTVIPLPASSNDIPPAPRRTQRGAARSDQSEVDGDSICGAPRAGDKGWREDWYRTQRKIQKRELEIKLAELEKEDLEADLRETARARRRR